MRGVLTTRELAATLNNVRLIQTLLWVQAVLIVVAHAVPLPPRVVAVEWTEAQVEALPKVFTSEPRVLRQEPILTPWIFRSGSKFEIPVRGGEARLVVSDRSSVQLLPRRSSALSFPDRLLGSFSGYLLRWSEEREHLLLTDSRSTAFWKLTLPGRVRHQNQRSSNSWSVVALGPRPSLFWIGRDLRRVQNFKWPYSKSQWIAVESCDAHRFIGLERLPGSRLRLSLWSGPRPLATGLVAWNPPALQLDAAMLWPETCQSIFVGGSFGLMHFTWPVD
jgi:hypothetical protein